jgi:hypothetical protein
MTIVYSVSACFTDGCTYGFSEVQHVFADKDIAEYIVDSANEKVPYNVWDCATTYRVDALEIDENTSMTVADKIVLELLKEYN